MPQGVQVERFRTWLHAALPVPRRAANSKRPDRPSGPCSGGLSPGELGRCRATCSALSCAFLPLQAGWSMGGAAAEGPSCRAAFPCSSEPPRRSPTAPSSPEKCLWFFAPVRVLA